VSFADHSGLILANMSIHLKNKDKIVTSADKPFQHAIDKCKGGTGGQEEVEMVIEEPYTNLEIVKQSALDHFNSILQKAQRLAAEAERRNPQKWPKRYDGKLTKMLK
jgi:hypothetical protein